PAVRVLHFDFELEGLLTQEAVGDPDRLRHAPRRVGQQGASRGRTQLQLYVSRHGALEGEVCQGDVRAVVEAAEKERRRGIVRGAGLGQFHGNAQSVLVESRD
ncbi:clathrin-adaptor gamma chain, partial [Nannochloropsis gaditana CCMP526]|uniref:clathrin-adaptor gamma chain n=1 Tax=Nannochloropsis gaditana (strain CCMP526) TaxID=1093141 RepID=UPI00029F5B5A